MHFSNTEGLPKHLGKGIEMLTSHFEKTAAAVVEAHTIVDKLSSSERKVVNDALNECASATQMSRELLGDENTSR